MLLCLAELFGSQDYPLRLEFIAFGNEESLPEVTEVYFHRFGDQVDSIVALLNFDGVGHLLDVNTVALLATSDELENMVQSMFDESSSWTRSSRSSGRYVDFQ